VVRVPAGAGNFSLHLFISASRLVLAHPASYPMGTMVPFLGVKQPDREADHSPPSSAEVKNVWSCISTLQYVYMAFNKRIQIQMLLFEIKHRLFISQSLLFLRYTKTDNVSCDPKVHYRLRRKPLLVLFWPR
jgi:hypothetical protein